MDNSNVFSLSLFDNVVLYLCKRGTSTLLLDRTYIYHFVDKKQKILFVVENSSP
jgi:hypothetical protein